MKEIWDEIFVPFSSCDVYIQSMLPNLSETQFPRFKNRNVDVHLLGLGQRCNKMMSWLHHYVSYFFLLFPLFLGLSFPLFPSSPSSSCSSSSLFFFPFFRSDNLYYHFPVQPDLLHPGLNVSYCFMCIQYNPCNKTEVCVSLTIKWIRSHSLSRCIVKVCSAIAGFSGRAGLFTNIRPRPVLLSLPIL